MFTLAGRILFRYVDRTIGNFGPCSHPDLRIAGSLLGLILPSLGLLFIWTKILGLSVADDTTTSGWVLMALMAYFVPSLLLGVTLPWYRAKAEGRE